MKKSELRQMIREVLKEELSSKKYLKESKFDSELPEIAYVLASKEGTGKCFLNIVYSANSVDFEPVYSIKALTPESYSCTKQEAIKYAKEAHNATLWDWNGTVSVLAVTNFKEAYLNKAKPKYTEIYSTSKAKNEDYSHLEPFECEHCGKKLFGDDYKMLYNPEQDYDEVVCYDCYDKASI